MLAFHRDVKDAAANRSLSERSRFLVQRWAELLDNHGHFSRSATAIVDPVTAVRDFFNAGNEFLSSPDFQYPSMLAAFKTTRVLITLERNLHTWFRPERDAGLAALKRVEPVRGNDQLARRRHVVRRTRGALQNEMLVLKDALEHPRQGYRARLLSAIVRANPSNEAQWRAFDENLAYLAALVVSEGRGGERLALDIARAFKNAKDDAAAMAAFDNLIATSLEPFTAALVLTGMKSLHSDVRNFGCEPLPSPVAWTPNGSAADRRLEGFMDNYAIGNACGVLVRVDALDHDHASRLSREAAEQLEDQLAAEHRIGRFALRPEALVRRNRDGRVRLIKDIDIEVRIARPRERAGLPELERSLRFHRLACNADAPVLAVAQSWIALEHLARGASARPSSRRPQRRPLKPAVFLPEHVAAVAFLAAARHIILSSWHVARKGCQGTAATRWAQIESWLRARQNGRVVDQDRWLELLQYDGPIVVPRRLRPDAPVAEAASLFWTVASSASPFVAHRLRDVAELVRRPSRLVFFASRAESRVSVTVSRIHLMRHRTVHGALISDDSAHQLAAAAHHVLDAVYEVIPNWLSPTQAPWEAFDQARDWSDQLKRSWDRSNAVLTGPVATIVTGPP
jgi:hypothetical protein